MNTISAQEILAEVKDGLSAPEWSQAVLCVRRGDAILNRRKGVILFYDIKMGRRLPFRVELNLEDGDWDCHCGTPAGTCAHAAAAALAFKRSKESPKTQPSTLTPTTAHIGFRIWSVPSSWVLRAVLVEPSGEELALTGTPGGDILLKACDEEILKLPGWTGQGEALQLSKIPTTRFQHLLTALSLASDVKVDGRSVTVTNQPVRAVLLVEDHRAGLRLRLGPPGLHHLTLPGPVPLVVVGDPAVLQPLGPSGLPSQDVSYYQGAPILPPSRIPHFLEHELPRLERHGRVSIGAKTLPTLKDLFPYPLLRISAAENGYDAIAVAAYGKPPIALVVGSRLIPSRGDVLPRRNLLAESRITKTISDDCGLMVGKRRSLRGVAAAKFAQNVVDQFPGEVVGASIAANYKIHRTQLMPRFSQGEAGLIPDVAFVLGKGGKQASPQEVLAAWQEGRGLVPLLDGGYAQLPDEWLRENGPLLEAIFDARGDRNESIKKVAAAQLIEAAEDTPDLGTLKLAARSILKARPVVLPKTVTATLRPYQQSGFEWLCHLEDQDLGGCLADDMGLGKTLQSLSLIARDMAGKKAEDKTPTLIVAPRSVIENWVNEAKKFVPGLATLLYHGPKRSLKEAKGLILVVTTYALLRLDEKKLAKIPWKRVILDEAQAIKNAKSLVSKAARRVKASKRFALTGTPVENHLSELWSILDFVNPGMLGSLQGFEDRYGTLTQSRSMETLKRLQVRITPFVLRRLKQDVAKDLPGKTEVVLKCTLNRNERKVYDTLLKAGRVKVQALLKEKGIGGGRMKILEQLLRLRQAACHTGLVPGAEDVNPGPSAKIKLLIEQLDVILDEGHKALVFSQWTGLLNKIEPALESAGIKWVRLDGSTRDRAGVVERFQSEDGPGVFLISLKAGGTGLNLTAADYVYLMDPWWNPAVEQQAIDRTYRIGQTRPVVATRLITSNSVEERILILQGKKRDLAEAALGGDVAWVGGLSDTELEALFH